MQTDLIKVRPVVLRQPFVGLRPFEALQIDVLLWLTRFDVFELDAL